MSRLFKPLIQLFDASGATAGAGTITFFAQGTTTLQSTFQDAARTLANENPLTVDGSGLSSAIYLQYLDYTVLAQDSDGGLLWQEDFDGRWLQDGSDYDVTLTGSVSRTVQARLEEHITPEDFGAEGSPTDDSTAIASLMAAGANKTMIFQSKTYLTGKFTPPNNCKIILPPGCIIKDTGSLGASERLVNITGTDLHIIGWAAKIIMTRADYTSGEQRHGIFVQGGKRITIDGLECSDCGGDGFIISYSAGEANPEDIHLNYCVAKNNRRNNMTVTAGTRIWINNPTLLNANGTNPQDGIDIEPDDDGAGGFKGSLDGIYITNGYSADNLGAGFSFNGGAVAASGETVKVFFINCISNRDQIGGEVENAHADVNGSVVWQNFRAFDSDGNGWQQVSSGIHTEVDGMWIHDANQDLGSLNQFGSSISIHSSGGTDGSTYGNLNIRNAHVFGTKALKSVTQFITGEATSVIENVDIEVESDAVTLKRAHYSLTASQITKKNRIKFLDETEFPTTASIASGLPDWLWEIVTNAGASGALTITLSSATVKIKGFRFTFRVVASQLMNIAADTSDTVDGGAELRSATPGSQVTIEYDGVSKWRVVHGGEGWFPTPIILDNTGTPSVRDGTMFETGGTTAITALDDGTEGQQITILVKHAVTFDLTGTTLKGNGGVDFVAAVDDVVHATFAGTNWGLSFVNAA